MLDQICNLQFVYTSNYLLFLKLTCIFFSPHRVFGVVLIIVDIIVVIVDLAISEKKRGIREILEGVSLAIALFFLVDVLMRVFVEG